MNALCEESERKEDIAAAQDEVSSVVVLDKTPSAFPSYCIPSYLIHNQPGGSYSFANTPLIAAHAPLAAASGIQGIFVFVFELVVGGLV